MIYKNSKYNKGYTLLFAVLVSSLVLAIGISILNINKKEFLLASSARESTTAFYAADGGMECAIYFDNRSRFTSGEYGNGITCGLYDSARSVTHDTSNPSAPYYTFDVNLNGQSCAKVKVTKAGKLTTIESRGYNIGWDTSGNGCSVASPRRVERALRYTYSL